MEIERGTLKLHEIDKSALSDNGIRTKPILVLARHGKKFVAFQIEQFPREKAARSNKKS